VRDKISLLTYHFSPIPNLSRFYPSFALICGRHAYKFTKPDAFVANNFFLDKLKPFVLLIPTFEVKPTMPETNESEVPTTSQNTRKSSERTEAKFFEDVEKIIAEAERLGAAA